MGELQLVDDGGLSFGESLTPKEVREKIIALQKYMESLPGSKEDLPVENEFCDGMYIRRLFIPKGTVIIGKIHKKQCINIVERGDISVLTETGSKRISAGFTIVSPPGLQKVGYAHEDTVFTNVFRSDETDLEKLEDECIWTSYEAMEQLTYEPDPLLIEGA